MFHRTLAFFLCSCAALWTSTAAAQFQYVQYRGMSPGWPNQQAANYTAYYAPQYGQPMYYVTRPTTAAYANPAYFGGYNVPAVAQRPVTAAYYAPQYYGGQYAQPTIAYYGSAPASHGAAQAYTVSPAGSTTAGAEANPYYGQPTAVNYVPPRFTYRTTMAQVPVYMYRPVTVYQPVTGQPVTCLQPTTTTQCVPQRTRTHSWFSHSWFNWGRSSCAGGACGSQPTTAYCAPAYAAPVATTCNSGQCGQPYYPTQPGVVVPVIPSQPAIVPGAAAPGTIVTPLPSAGPTVPPPPTRIVPGTSGGAISPADSRPSLSPGTFGPRLPSAPSTIVPSSPGSFPTDPSTPSTIVPSPATPFNPGTRSFGTGSGYTPAIDPYSQSGTSSGSAARPDDGRIGGPELRAAAPARTIQEPTSPVLAPGIQTVPDPDALQPARPINRAPQLLDPRDKTAAAQSPAKRARPADQRWAVVPAVWPKPAETRSSPAMAPAAPGVPERSPYRNYKERSYDSPSYRPVDSAAGSALYDDSGWTSAR
jgi:hypothetical protein